MVELDDALLVRNLLVASLGFLGLGVQPPSPDWGLQINEARNHLLGTLATLLPGRGNRAAHRQHQPDELTG